MAPDDAVVDDGPGADAAAVVDAPGPDASTLAPAIIEEPGFPLIHNHSLASRPRLLALVRAALDGR